MEKYEHRQYLDRRISVLFAGLAALFLFLRFAFPNDPVVPWLPSVVLAIVVAAWWMISVLITRVDRSGVSWSFAWGWPRGHVPFGRLARVESTKLNLLERGGAGLHWTVWHGWLWNVAGAEAVELFLTDGGRITIGTDDPQGLQGAIDRFRNDAA
jgi:hypothetical protein